MSKPFIQKCALDDMRACLALRLPKQSSWTPEQVLVLFDSCYPNSLKPSINQAACGHYVHGGILGCSCTTPT